MGERLNFAAPVADTSWRRRLYDSYVSSGQAAQRPVSERELSPYEVYGPFAAQTRHFIARYLPPNREARVVDLGCGDGLLVHFLLEAGYQQVSGVDLSPQQIARAHRMGLLQLRQGDIDGFLAALPPESVDVVLAIDIFEHLTRSELFRVLDAVFRVLSPNGVCVAHVPNAEGLYGLRVRYGDLTHEQAFTERSAGQLFRTVGFRQVASFEDKPVMHGVTSVVRRLLWEVGTLPHRVLLAAETGEWGARLSQNIVVRAVK